MAETGVIDPNNLNSNETQNRSNNHRRNKQSIKNPRHLYRPFNNSNYDSYQNYQEGFGYSNYSNIQTNHYDFYGRAELNSKGHSSNRNFYQNRNTNFRPHSSSHKPKKTNNDNKEQSSNQAGEINVEKNDSKRNKQRAKKPIDAKDNNSKEPTAKAPTKDKFANLSRSEMLIGQLKKSKCECMVCYSVIRSDKQIWSCQCCFHIFHLSCIKKWALSPAAKIAENSPKWRCPGCQTVFDSVPNKYVCFCGKKTNPEKENRLFNQLKLIPHSCNEVCAKSLGTSGQLEGLECKHKCTDICHPGPCHPCEALVNRRCNCSRAKFQVKCSSSKVPQCDEQCAQVLNCLVHKCEKICHSGTCGPCDLDVEIKYHSHQDVKIEKCGSSEHNQSKDLMFNCDRVCDRLLDCKKHRCQENCQLFSNSFKLFLT